MASRPTIRDVAAASGYSITTVSMVLNHKKVSIPAETRDKVWQAAKKLNYRPNSLAVSLITKRTQVLGLIIPDNRSLFFSALSREIEMEARKAGYGLIYGNSGNKSKRDLEYIEMFLDRQVDGILLLMSSINNRQDVEDIMRTIKQNRVPVVTVDRSVPDGSLLTVQMHHENAGYLATLHLLQLGHRRIGCCISPGYITARIQRGVGYRKALEEFGVPFDEDLLVEVSYEEGTNNATFQKMLDNKATAFLAINDSMALEFYRYAKQNGIRIPQDISIVGSDDASFADMISPPLTTIRQPVKKMGEAAIQALLEMIEHPETLNKNALIQFEPQLIVRESTSKPNRAELLV